MSVARLTLELFPAWIPCQSSDLEVPEACGKAKEVIKEGIQVISDAVSQAMEALHPADGVLYGNPDLRVFPVMPFLLGSEFWMWVIFRFSRCFEGQVDFCPATIVFVRAQEPEVHPYRDFVKPWGLWIEELLQKLIVMDASGHDATQEKDGFVCGRYNEAFQGMTTLFTAIAGFLLFVVLRPNASAFHPIYQNFIIFIN
jgi:hypothetical protein